MSIFVYICLFLSVSICISVYIYLNLSIYVSICLYLTISVYISVSFCLYLSLSAYICLNLSISVYFCLFMCLFISQFIYSWLLTANGLTWRPSTIFKTPSAIFTKQNVSFFTPSQTKLWNKNLWKYEHQVFIISNIMFVILKWSR